MTWIYIGIVAGSLVATGFDSQEKCEGRRAMLEKQKISGKCVEAPMPYGISSFTTISPVWSNTVPAN